MAIPFSAPPGPRPRRHPRHHRAQHRESLAASTGTAASVGDTAFGDLNLSSQLLCLALVEAMRVLETLAGEETVETGDQDQDHLGQGGDSVPAHTQADRGHDWSVLPKKNIDEEDKECEECTKYEEPAEGGKVAGPVPDLLADIHTISTLSTTCDLIDSVAETKAGDKAAQLPDLVPAVSASSPSPSPSPPHTRTPPHHRLLVTGDGRDQPGKGFVALNKSTEIVPDRHRQDSEDKANTWRMIGRDLARIADSQHGAGVGGHFRDFPSPPAPASGRHYAAAADFERVVGMNRSLPRREDDNRNNHHLHNRLCHHQLPSDYNLHIAASPGGFSLTNLALTGLLYIVNNLL